MNFVTLNNGKKMPVLGFGVYQITDDLECENAVVHALEAGYRMIDTASVYMNEAAVGKAIRRSGIPRTEIFVTTKVWVQDMGYQQTLDAIDRSLERLQLDYIDMYLIHQPYSDVFGTWRAMEDKYEEGILHAIGVSNFSSDRLIDLSVFNRISPMLNQVEINPYYQQEQNVAFMKQHKVQPQSWASFAEGRNNLFSHPVLNEIAGLHRKSVAQVVLRWLVQRDIIVIPKSVNPERMKQNIDVFDFELSATEMLTISRLDTGESCFHSHTDPERIKILASKRFDI